MTMGQTMLTAAFLVLLTVASMTMQRMVVESREDEAAVEPRELALDAAQILMKEILSKKFDAKADTSNYQTATNFTTASALGPDKNETITLPDVAPFSSVVKYDDVDDYHGYRRVMKRGEVGGYRLQCEVYYVTASKPDLKTTTRTFFKKITVTVTHDRYLTRPITLSSLVTY